MDLDLARLRAFTTAAEQLHFGRAAEVLSLTQQAVSKRVAALERDLGVRLFDRGPRGVQLTAAGERLLGPARTALAAGAAAVTAVRQQQQPLRLDVWGHLFAPLRIVRQVLGDGVEVQVEVGSGRDLPSVAGALVRGEAGAGLGRFHQLADGRSDRLAHRLVRLEPVDAVIAAGHPLARRDALRPADLSPLDLLLPATAERLDFLRHFAQRFSLRTAPGEANLGFDHLLARAREVPDSVVLLPAELPLPPGCGLVPVPLVDPTPLYAWSLVWHRDRPDPGVGELLRGCADTGRRRRWLEYRPERDWLPEADRAAVDEL